MSMRSDSYHTRTAESYFDGNLFQYVLISFFGYIATFLSLGLLYPWALCRIYGWKIDHTVIEGRRLEFHGRAMSLFANWVKWLFLIFITFGIYGFWVHIKLEDWKVRNTFFSDY